MSKNTNYADFFAAEISRYPEVSFQIKDGRKNRRLILVANGKSRFVIFPLTPSDRRGWKNGVSTIRKELRNLGVTV